MLSGRLVAVMAAIPLGVVATANAGVVLEAGVGPQSPVAPVPRSQAALVIGAALKLDGSPGEPLADRIRAATELYRSGKVGKLLLAGDDRAGYDEVEAMRTAFVARGVPAEDLLVQPESLGGVSGVDSARRVFGVRSVVVVTGEATMDEAMSAARKAGLRATGYSAERRPVAGVQIEPELRQAIARIRSERDV